ncbi:MAG: hypothetical protein Q4A60_05695 [Pasteurellaceae bacterium]|nr:hypothetical protein [Pasteurellaceae bacterium]
MDQFPYKIPLLIFGLCAASLSIDCFHFIADNQPLVMILGIVILFSLLLSLNTIITTQYVITQFNADYDIAYAHYSKLSSLGLMIASLSLAFFYHTLPASYFFYIASLLYFISALTLLPNLKVHTFITTHHSPKPNLPIFATLKHSLGLLIPICCVAFSESAFNVNFEVIAFTLKSTPFFIIFLFGLISGLLDWITSHLYPRYFSPLPEKHKWQLLLASFSSLFFLAFLMDRLHYAQQTWFLPTLAILLEIIGIIWGIFIAAKIRSVCPSGQYGQMMAIFRIPRAMITFIGIIGIGALLDQQALWFVFFINTVLFILTSVFLIFRQRKS